MGEWTEAFLAEDRENDSIFEAVRWLICAPAETAEPEAYWYMYAAQGFARPMLSSLLQQQRIQLKEFFDTHYPRRDRMPVQEEIYKVLSKETGGKKWGLFR